MRSGGKGSLKTRKRHVLTEPALPESCAAPSGIVGSSRSFSATRGSLREPSLDFRSSSYELPSCSPRSGAPRLRADAGLEPIAANREVTAVDLNLGRRATRRGSGRDGVGRSDSRQGEHQKNELLAHDSPPSRETGLPATSRPLSSPYPTPVALAQVQRETGRRRSSSRHLGPEGRCPRTGAVPTVVQFSKQRQSGEPRACSGRLRPSRVSWPTVVGGFEDSRRPATGAR